MGIHSGHRERMKQRFRESGLDGFHDVNVLEMLLFYVIPRQDTNPLAHALLEEFGSLEGVLDAGYEELLEVPGVGESVATFLRLFPSVCKRYIRGKQMKKIPYTTLEQLEDFVIPMFTFDMEETLYMICMDSGNHVTFCDVIGQGNEDSIYVDPKQVVRLAMKRRAERVVLAHNHPSGVAAPSVSDISLTNTLKDSLALFNIELMDHFIVAGETCASLRKHGYF